MCGKLKEEVFQEKLNKELKKKDMIRRET